MMSYRCDTEVKMIFLFMEINPDVTVTVLRARPPDELHPYETLDILTLCIVNPVRKSLR